MPTHYEADGRYSAGKKCSVTDLFGRADLSSIVQLMMTLRERYGIITKSAELTSALAMSEISIKLKGLPEKVQRIADALEEAFPGMIAWVLSEEDTDGIAIRIEGYELPLMPIQMLKSRAA